MIITIFKFSDKKALLLNKNSNSTDTNNTNSNSTANNTKANSIKNNKDTPRHYGIMQKGKKTNKHYSKKIKN